MDEREQEIAELARLVREHLEWERGLAGTVVPEWSAAPVSEPAPEPGPEPVPEHTAPRLDPVPERAPAAPLPAAPAPPPAAAARPALDPTERLTRLEVLAAEAAACTLCRLHEHRTHSVFARGSAASEIVFVGEGPGFHEDQQGLPFVGPAGQLLDKMIGAMGYGRDEVYVCNVVKCRPPENRTPLPDEAGACARYLVPQLELVAPKVIVALGRSAAETLGCAEPGRSWRGMWGSWHPPGAAGAQGIPVMPTYHPAFLLRSPEMKRPVWEDLQKVLARLGKAPPKRG